jgi:hypothetical protein
VVTGKLSVEAVLVAETSTHDPDALSHYVPQAGNGKLQFSMVVTGMHHRGIIHFDYHREACTHGNTSPGHASLPLSGLDHAHHGEEQARQKIKRPAVGRNTRGEDLRRGTAAIQDTTASNR